MAKKILVEIDDEGNCSIDGHGFVGPECDKFINEMEKVLGKTLESRKRREYNQKQIRRQRNLNFN